MELNGFCLRRLTNSTSGALELPSGSEADRPSLPAHGSLRYNETVGQLEAYVAPPDKAASWGPVAGSGDAITITITFGTLLRNISVRIAAWTCHNGVAAAGTFDSLPTFTLIGLAVLLGVFIVFYRNLRVVPLLPTRFIWRFRISGAHQTRLG